MGKPIGILDSGVGGLTIWKEIAALLPHEQTIYLGDSRNAPYGVKNSEEITVLAQSLIQFLLKQDAKLIVVACNTITLNSIDALREAFPAVPIIGTVPVIKGAAQQTKTKRIGLLATSAGGNSLYVQNLIKTHASNCDVIIVSTDKLVPLIENGGSNTEEMKVLLKEELKPFVGTIDTLVLGSTHFPFIRSEIQDILGPGVLLLDTGPAIARQTKRILEANKLVSVEKKEADHFYTTGSTQKLRDHLESLIGKSSKSVIQQISI